MSKIELIPWYKLPGNPFIVSLSALMLLDNGYQVTKVLKTGKNQPERTFKVTYDRQFIIESLINLFIEPLEVVKPEELHQLLDDAIEYWEWCKTVEKPDYLNSKSDFRNYCRHIWTNQLSDEE
jgi:hypothetical protein